MTREEAQWNLDRDEEERFVSEEDFERAEREAPHQHEEHIESVGTPSRSGIVRVTMYCECGKEMRSYNDTIL